METRLPTTKAEIRDPPVIRRDAAAGGSIIAVEWPRAGEHLDSADRRDLRRIDGREHLRFGSEAAEPIGIDAEWLQTRSTRADKVNC
jgi:anti-sigma factor RsiW